MLVYYFVPFIVSNRYLLFWVSNGHNFVTVQNRTHVYMNFFDHKDLGNHLLQLCPKVVKHPVYGDWILACWMVVWLPRYTERKYEKASFRISGQPTNFRNRDLLGTRYEGQPVLFVVYFKIESRHSSLDNLGRPWENLVHDSPNNTVIINSSVLYFLFIAVIQKPVFSSRV